MFKHQQLARKTTTPRSLKMRARTIQPQCRAWGKTEVFFIQRCAKVGLGQRVLTVDYAVWGALQQTVYHHQSVSPVVELKRAIAKAWQKRHIHIHRQKCR